MVSVFVDGDDDCASSSAASAILSNKRKHSLFNPSGRRSSRLSSLLSLSSSRKSAPTCTISLECATINNVPCHTSDALAHLSVADVNVIPFPSSDSDTETDLDSAQLDAGVKVRRRSLQATPRSSLSEEQRTRQDSAERTRKSSVSKRKPAARRALVHHNLLAPASHLPPLPPPRKRLPHMKQSDLRFMTVVRRSVQVGLDARMVDHESDLQEQDRMFVLRLGAQLAERGVRDDCDSADAVLTPSQIVATATLRRRDSAATRSRPLPSQRKRSPLASL